MTHRLFGEAEYPEHVPVCAYEDTGERKGFVTSVIPGADGQRETELEDGVGVGDGAALDFMTVSAADLADMEGVRVASMKVSTAEERAKFSEMWATYATTSSRRDKMAVDWNADVDNMIKAGKDAIRPIFRKTAGHLEQYWKQSSSVNIGVLLC